ncbi:hypothetical protein KC909_05045 [Candidatus Dojkabacteria bacterium]|uniref:Uncharacterized protein n=1 Tax=Candidatus Dojkabacteria bacterium TaxID=2099670 RepID=A0A955L617_9BACT|nr:hypothetical protein [Candidatus Dojkabacteria bacterium]
MNDLQDSSELFEDPYNPTENEIRTWAYGEYYAPVQDFELFIVDYPLLVLQLAGDSRSKAKEFCLRSLYVWVGDIVRGDQIVEFEKVMKQVLDLAGSSKSIELQKFAERASELIANPDIYTYEKWGLDTDYV